jgi:phage protein U
MYAKLGTYIFKGYKGFKDLEITDAIALAEHPVIEGKPRLQAVGMKLRKIELSFLLHSTFSNPEDDVEALRAFQRRAEILPFLAGNGIPYGNFVIEEIKSGVTQSDNNGNIIGIEIELQLLESVLPPGSENQATSKLATKTPGIVIKGVSPKPSDPQFITTNMRTVNTNVKQMDKELSSAGKIVAQTERALRLAKKRVDQVRKSIHNIEQVGAQTQTIIGLYAQAQGQVTNVKNATESLSGFVEAGDINSSIAASTQLRAATDILNTRMAPIQNLTTARRISESPLITP